MEALQEIKRKSRVSFKQVHKDLEEANIFIKKDHDVFDFGKKGTFLSSIGFANSIATRMYLGIKNSTNEINDMNSKYLGVNKYIIEPQLELLCEKYDLYVRDLTHFAGDIPKKNIKEMMVFRLYLDDYISNVPAFNNSNLELVLNQLNIVPNGSDYCGGAPMSRVSIDLRDIVKLDEHFRVKTIEIAATKDLFLKSAFIGAKGRIITQRQELESISEVDTDPIVMVKTKNGRIIVTAWGDEANDEIVFNSGQN